MKDTRFREFIIEDEEPENFPQTCTQSLRRKLPPKLETATDTDEHSTTIDIYTQERKTVSSLVSPTQKLTIVYIRPTNEEIQGLETAIILSSYRIDGIDAQTVRDRLLPTLGKLIYRGERHLEEVDTWEYLYSYMNRKEVNEELKNQVERIR